MARILSSFLVLVFSLILLQGGTSVIAKYVYRARLGVVNKSVLGDSGAPAALSPEFVTYNYTQTLDHFNYKPESFATFQQWYIVNSKYWGGANTSSPIFVYTGAEDDVTRESLAVGFVPQLASRFKVLLVYIEHRYYGTSMPFGSSDETYKNASTLGFFTSEQTLGDYAQVVTYLKTKMSADNCPVIAIGASYGGMLASWFRLKYPHIVYGALASSAPILYFIGVTPENAYPVVVSKDFNDTSTNCYNTIRESWFEMDKVAARPNGLANLSRIFNTCKPLNSTRDLKEYIRDIYYVSAQYDRKSLASVELICAAIDGAAKGTSVLDRIMVGLRTSIYVGSCFFVPPYQVVYPRDGWSWQRCTEMVMPMGNDENDTMFQADPFNLTALTNSCEEIYGTSPRPYWIPVEFGGHKIKSVLEKFASNIIFSNGLRDLYSAGGVLHNISDTIVAVHTNYGTHCMDLLAPNPKDPNWLVTQRQAEIDIIGGWLSAYMQAQ